MTSPFQRTSIGTVQGKQRTVKVGAAVPEEAPTLSHRLDFIKIEGFHQDGLLSAPALLAQFSEGSGDEGRPIKREAATVAFLGANAVGGDQAERQGGLPVDKPARNTQVSGLCKSTVPQTTPE